MTRLMDAGEVTISRKLPFKVSAKAARLIGRENVANAEGAIVELVKNTYDADADHCYILFTQKFQSLPISVDDVNYRWLTANLGSLDQIYERDGIGFTLSDNIPADKMKELNALISTKRDLWIIDNGRGMSADIIEKYWMVIGTNFKEEFIFSDGGRVRTGAKGIGRFALDRLGSYCGIRSTFDSGNSSGSIDWEVDWSEFEGVGKVLDDVEASLSSIHQTIFEMVRANSAYEIFSEAFEEANKLRDWQTGTAIRITGLRDSWSEKDIDHLFKSLSALVPPDDQRPLKIYVLDDQRPDRWGEVAADTLADFDYKLLAEFDGKLGASITIFRNELRVEDLSADLFRREDMRHPRFQVDAFKNGSVTFYRKFEDWYPNATEQQLDALRGIGPFSFNLLFYKRSLVAKDERSRYPYRSFQTAPRKRWLNIHGGIRVYRDDFLVRPYGEPGGKAYDWLGLGQRVASNPAQASRKGWRVSPQSLAGTIKISRARNPLLVDQSNREGLIENDALSLFRGLIVRAIREFEDDRSHILFNLAEFDRERNPTVTTKSEGESAAERVDNNPAQASAADAVALAAAFRVQQTEIRELKTEQGLLRSLATLGTVLVSFSHEMGQLQSTLGGRVHNFDRLLRTLIPSERLAGLPEAANPYLILKKWDASDQKIRQWFNFALTAVKAGKRSRREINIRAHLSSVQATWESFLSARVISFSYEISDGFDPTIVALEIDLDSIFSNLILNSVEAFIGGKHAGRRDIEVHVRPEGDSEMLITYTDSGPGLSASFERERQIFAFGETTKTDPTSDADGTGIGMWILESIVSEYGGTVEAFRPSNNWGFKLEMRLPVVGGRRSA